MIELPDDELDKLFRKSSEELDPIYEPDEWNDLKKRLDAEDGITPAGAWRKWLPLGLLFFIFSAGGILFGLRENGTKNTEESGQHHKAAEVKSNKKESTDVIRRIKTDEKDSLANVPETGRGAQITAVEKDKTKSNPEKILPPSRSKAGGVYLEPNRSSGKVGEGAFLTSRKPVEKSRKAAARKERDEGEGVSRGLPGQVISTPATEEVRSKRARRESDALMGDQVSYQGKEGRENSRNISPWPVERENLPWMRDQQALFPRLTEWNGPALPAVEEPALEKNVARIPDNKTREPLFAVRFGYAPDLSTVGLKDFSRPGSAVSMLGEWAVFKRTYLQTGAIWSNKIYSAPGKAYIIPKELHDYGPAPASVDGECKVFELPLNIRYDVYQGESARWFATAGVTSYHMNSEAYKYNFENENDPKIKYRAWQGATGWYLFSHLNASAGYEYRLTTRLSLMAEPYLKIPLKRVGYGKVNLFTTGAWISLRYTPVFKMK